jgi:hypothetical protein
LRRRRRKITAYRRKGEQEDGEEEVDEIKKVKEKLPVSLIKHHATNVYGGTGGIALRSLNVSSKRMGEASIKPRPIYFRQKYPRYPWVRGQVGSRTGLEATGKENLNFIRTQNWIPRLSSPQPSHYSN